MSNYRRYFENSANPVFITFVTYKRSKILITNINIIRKSSKHVKSRYKFEIIAISVLKNHCHMIISADKPTDVPGVIRTIKYDFSKNVPEQYICKSLSDSAIKRGEKGIWQRRYYDHIIRDEDDLFSHIDYIHYNSVKHYNIAPCDWEYSSFKNFVKDGYYDMNWCNLGDKHCICNLNYE